MTAFGPQIIIALIAGLLLGLLAKNMGTVGDGEPNWLTTTLNTIGTSYVSLLKAAVVPLIFTAVVSSIANLREVSNAARLAWQTLLWFAITALIAVVIGILMGVLVFELLKIILQFLGVDPNFNPGFGGFGGGGFGGGSSRGGGGGRSF